MTRGGPYRPITSSSWDEEELWLRLDEALEMALDRPADSCQLAWWILDDCDGFPDVRRSTEALLCDFFGPLPPDWDCP